MKPSGIGGQAVIEGIMMRNKNEYSIAVRKPDKEIEVVVKESKLLTEKYKWLNYPIIRGVFNFVDSLVTGISTINYSASFYDDPSEQETTKADEIGKAVFKDKIESLLMAMTIIFSIVFAVGLFMLIPYFASRLLTKYIGSKFVLNLAEGLIRLIIFILYIIAISMMKDIKRTYMYHGAEHKCINCIERGVILTPENVKNSSRFHKRCGTSFLFLVMFISIIFFIFIRVDNTILQLIIRVLLIPVIAGVSYEVIRFAGKSDGKLINIVSKPGIWMQHLTTKEPDMDMIEVAIKAVEAVFDWKQFLIEYYKDSENPFEEMQQNEAELAFASDLLNSNENTRSIKTKDLENTVKESETVKDNENSVKNKYIENHIKSVYEESDDSESTEYDNNYDDSELDNSLEESEDELPEGFEIIEDDDAFDNTFINRESVGITDENTSVIEKKENSYDTSETENNSSEKSDESMADSDIDENMELSDSKKNKDKDVVEEGSEEETNSESDDDGIEFVEDDVEDEIVGDDIPLFKERRDEK